MREKLSNMLRLSTRLRLVRRTVGWLLVGLLILASAAAGAAAEPTAAVPIGESRAVVAGNQVDLGFPAHLLDGAAWASVRPIAEGLGARVTWNGSTSEATVTLGARTLRFQAGSATATVNGSRQELPRPVHILNGKMQVPLRTLGEGLGFRVQWVAGENTVLFGPSDTAAAEATLQVREHPELGRILTDRQGMTLYAFTRDAAYLSNCYGQCEQNWPPLTVESAGTAVAEVTGTLGVTLRQDGSRQVTLNGMPLYYFARDEKAGDAAGQGLNDVWYVLSPAGELIKMKPAPDSEAPAGSAAQSLQVTVNNFAYSPATITVKAGDTVTWTNQGNVPHTVTGESFDSGILQKGASFTYTFETAGTFSYICTLHPSMKGTLVVE